MTTNVTFVLESVENAVKIPNAALRFKPSRDQMTALYDKFGGGRPGRGSGSAGSGGRGRRERGSGEGMGSGGPRGERPMRADGASGASAGGGGGGRSNDPNRKTVWKLVDGKPRMTMIRIGLTDGSTTQLVDGDLQPGDQLITEIQGLPTNVRGRTGAF
jgi:HlyD family secretion protein